MSSFIPARALRRLFGALICLALATCASAADYFKPEAGKGPAVIVISGNIGTPPYRWFAIDVAKLGYTAILVHGGFTLASEADSAESLRQVIADSQRDPRVVPGKVAVIGFSSGGGTALLHASPLSASVAGVVAFFPALRHISNIGDAAARVAVPTLVMTGERDTYGNCCGIELQREFETAARAAKVPFELVTYPNAGHSFNIGVVPDWYRPGDAADAWERTRALLAKTHPIKPADSPPRASEKPTNQDLLRQITAAGAAVVAAPAAVTAQKTRSGAAYWVSLA